MRQHGECHPDTDTTQNPTRTLRPQCEEQMVSKSLGMQSLEHMISVSRAD